MQSVVHEGEIAPDFMLPDQDGAEQALSDYRGKWVLLYFYPKDDTPGCTKEACMIRDSLPQFTGVKSQVLGISADSVASHTKFAEKYSLRFPLLADEKKEVIEKYDVWGEKNFMGRKYMGIKRTSFLIGPDGIIKKVYEKVRPDIHAEEVLNDLKAFGA